MTTPAGAQENALHLYLQPRAQLTTLACRIAVAAQAIFMGWGHHRLIYIASLLTDGTPGQSAIMELGKSFCLWRTFRGRSLTFRVH
jgi:hypothetical protein